MNTLRPLSLCALLFLLGCEQTPKTMFTRIDPSDSNIEFENVYQETMELNPFTFDYVYHGAGVAAGDVNNDGLVDLYFSGNTTSNKLYLNKGDFEFEDVTKESHTEGKKSWATGVTIVDVNGDGWKDIYVCYSGIGMVHDQANMLYINLQCEPGGTPDFREMSEQFGLDALGTLSTQACFFDYDLDGDLDMFLLNHSLAYRNSPSRAMKNRLLRHPQSGNRLYRNDNNHFSDVSEEAGIYGGWLNIGLSVSVSDFNNDLYPDLYVSNDFDEQDYFYVNSGNGTFSQSIEKSFPHISKFSMGSDIADFNNDNLPDVLTLDMLPEDNYRQKVLRGSDDFDRYNFLTNHGYHKQHMRNMLHLNRGTGADGLPVFSEIGQLSGVSNTDWSWSGLFGDFDNDGNKDMFVTNGYVRDLTNLDFQRYDFEQERQKARDQGLNLSENDGKEFMLKFMRTLKGIAPENYVFRNTGDLKFDNKTKEWGLNEKAVTTGGIYVDLDNDGDLDLVTSNINSPVTVYRNNADKLSENNFVTVRLVGDGKNTAALGAKAYLQTDTITQFAESFCGRGFMSSVDPSLHFGVGKAKQIETLKVVWPDKRVTVLSNFRADTIITLYQKDAGVEAVNTSSDSTSVQLPIFKDISKNIGVEFLHKENDYVDFKFDRLLLYQLSKQGPRLSVGDINGDGLNDIFIGGPSGYAGSFLMGTRNNQFKQETPLVLENDKSCEDVDSELFDADNDGDLDLAVVSGGIESPDGSENYRHRIYINVQKGKFAKSELILDRKSPASCITSADFDNDGDADLLIGGGSIPQSYPKASPTTILRNETAKGGKPVFVDVTASVCPALDSAGLVTDALWVDLDKNGFVDLVVVGHWMPIRVFMNQAGKLTEKVDTTLSNATGLWNTITAIDTDNDGDLDLLAGNTGSNGELKASQQYPIELFLSDIDNNGKLDPIITHYIGGVCYPIATRDDLISQVPSVKKKFVRYEAYASATIDNVLDKEARAKAQYFSVKELRTMRFENDGGEFTAHELPTEVQFAPVQKFVNYDFTGDGFNDLLVLGNFHPYRVEYGPFDASYGTLLSGSKSGNFGVLPFRSVGPIGGDIRDAVLLKNDKTSPMVVVSKNCDFLQVLELR